MPRLLILTYHFPPTAASGTFRMLGFARHLPACGWQPIVVAPPRLPWEPLDHELAKRVPPEAIVHAASYPSGRFSKPFRRFARHALWLPGALKTAIRAYRTHRPDAVLTSSPPHWVHLIGLFLKRSYGLPWLADFRDPWVTDGEPRSHPPLGIRWRALWEKQVMRHADAVIANAPQAAEILRAAFPANRDKVVTITNGFDVEDCPALTQPEVAGGPLSMVHAGELYEGRDPRPVLEALQQLRADGMLGPDELRVSFLGTVAAEEHLGFDLAADMKQRGVEGLVSLQGQVSYAKSLASMAQADIQLLLDRPGRRVGVPAKLYEYLGTGRPILALTEPTGDSAWVLKESGVCHRVAHPQSVTHIRQALAELIGELKQDRNRAPDAERLFRFTRQYMAQRLATVANDCVARNRTAPDDAQAADVRAGRSEVEECCFNKT